MATPRPRSKAAPAAVHDLASALADLTASDREVYVRIDEHSVHHAGHYTVDAPQLAPVLNVCGDLVWPGRDAKRSQIAFPRYWLTPEQIAVVPFLATIARQLLPPNHQLVVAVWEDGTVAMTALPKPQKHPPPWWPLLMHNTAICAPALATASVQASATRMDRKARFWTAHLQRDLTKAKEAQLQRQLAKTSKEAQR